MVDNNKYNKIKVLYELSALCWFIDKHALPDAQKAGESACSKMLEELKKDIDKHIAAFDKHACK
jgi:hypothetical protein